MHLYGGPPFAALRIYQMLFLMSYRVSILATFDAENPEILGCHGFQTFETLAEACDFIKNDPLYSRFPLIEIQRGESDLFSPFVPCKDVIKI